jgi:hypothetical protein
LLCLVRWTGQVAHFCASNTALCSFFFFFRPTIWRATQTSVFFSPRYILQVKMLI